MLIWRMSLSGIDGSSLSPNFCEVEAGVLSGIMIKRGKVCKGVDVLGRCRAVCRVEEEKGVVVSGVNCVTCVVDCPSRRACWTTSEVHNNVRYRKEERSIGAGLRAEKISSAIRMKK